MNSDVYGYSGTNPGGEGASEDLSGQCQDWSQLFSIARDYSLGSSVGAAGLPNGVTLNLRNRS
jgi:hypothetical protein